MAYLGRTLGGVAGGSSGWTCVEKVLHPKGRALSHQDWVWRSIAFQCCWNQAHGRDVAGQDVGCVCWARPAGRCITRRLSEPAWLRQCPGFWNPEKLLEVTPSLSLPLAGWPHPQRSRFLLG